MRSARRPPTKLFPVYDAPMPPPAAPPLLLRARVAFVLYALGVVGGLCSITALIERAAP